MVRKLQIFRILRRDTRGVALTEFAFAAPIFLTLVMSGLELSNLALAHLRVSQMAMTVADNAGRVTGGIDEANIYEVFTGAQYAGSGLDFKEHGRMVLSSLQHNNLSGNDEGQTIVWQRCWGDDKSVRPKYGREGHGRDNDDLEAGLGSGGNKITALRDTAVMFVEATYQYQPLVTTGFFTTPTIRYESAFNVRGRQNNVISNTQDLDEMTC
mgnify:CR=1 FL=1